MPLVIPTDSLVVAIQGVSDGQLGGGSIRLFTNDFVPGPNTVLADITEATFSGYAAVVTANWGQPFLNPQGFVEVDAPSAQFNHNGGAIVESVFGYYVTDAGGALVTVERFAAGPYLMETALNSIIVVPRYALQVVPNVTSHAN